MLAVKPLYQLPLALLCATVAHYVGSNRAKIT